MCVLAANRSDENGRSSPPRLNNALMKVDNPFTFRLNKNRGEMCFGQLYKPWSNTLRL